MESEMIFVKERKDRKKGEEIKPVFNFRDCKSVFCPNVVKSELEIHSLENQVTFSDAGFKSSRT
jgi:hypothetical protein